MSRAERDKHLEHEGYETWDPNCRRCIEWGPVSDNAETREALVHAAIVDDGLWSPACLPSLRWSVPLVAHTGYDANPDAITCADCREIVGLAALPPVAGPEVRPDETLRAVLPLRLAVAADGTVWRIFAPDGVGLTEETWSLAPHSSSGQQVEPVTYYEPAPSRGAETRGRCPLCGHKPHPRPCEYHMGDGCPAAEMQSDQEADFYGDSGIPSHEFCDRPHGQCGWPIQHRPRDAGVVPGAPASPAPIAQALWVAHGYDDNVRAFYPSRYDSFLADADDLLASPAPAATEVGEGE